MRFAVVWVTDVGDKYSGRFMAHLPSFYYFCYYIDIINNQQDTGSIGINTTLVNEVDIQTILFYSCSLIQGKVFFFKLLSLFR